jgi:serine/threonine-protein phosphatase 6 regulatory ankyrin repeat subunit B
MILVVLQLLPLLNQTLRIVFIFFYFFSFSFLFLVIFSRGGSTVVVDVNLCDSEEVTPLLSCTVEGHAEIVRVLLSCDGIDVNLGRADGVTPLYAACDRGWTEVVKLLAMQEDLDPNLTTNDGATCLWVASQNGHLDVVRHLLLRKDLNVNLAKNCVTPLFTACLRGNVRVVQLLLSSDHDIDVNRPNNSGDTPLNMVRKVSLSDVILLYLTLFLFIVFG